jgi:alpha-1,2-mannosyltransferase
LAVALYLVVRRWVAPALRGWAAAGALAASCALEPVTANLDYGQVNIVLLALVAADCLARKPRWPRGALVGLAVAIKLTPAVFLLYFLVRRDLRAIAMSAASFAAFTALGFAAAPAQSARYWTEVLFDSSRIGPQTYPGNQAITGVLARASAPAQTVLWLLASAAVVAACAWIMLRASNAAQPELALAVNALAGLLISPISWSHHWVWLPVAAAALALAGWQLRSPLLAGAAALGLACGYLGPQWRVADARWAGTGWSAVDQLAASSYVWWALAAIAAVALALRPPRHAPTAR